MGELECSKTRRIYAFTLTTHVSTTYVVFYGHGPHELITASKSSTFTKQF